MPLTIDQAEVRRLSPAVIPFDRAVGWIVAAAVSGIVLVALPILWLTGTVTGWPLVAALAGWMLLTAGLAWLAHFWPVKSYDASSYRVDQTGIEIRTGVYWRKVILVPRSRVQHIDVRQGPMHRSYDLAVLVIYTAGTEHSSVSLSGLDHYTAIKLRDVLLPEMSDDGV